MHAPEYTSVSLINSHHAETYYNKEMLPEVKERYEQRILSLSIQLIKTLRRAFRNERTDYATLMIHPILNAFGHVTATAMYDALLAASRNGTAEIHAATNNNEGVYILARPYFQAQQNAERCSISNTSATSQSRMRRTSTSPQQTLPLPQRVVAWAAIRHLTIYRRNGA